MLLFASLVQFDVYIFFGTENEFVKDIFTVIKHGFRSVKTHENYFLLNPRLCFRVCVYVCILNNFE